MTTFKTFIIGLLLICCSFKKEAAAQDLLSGVFFLRKDIKDCPYSIMSVNKIEYCTGLKPVIHVAEFKSISDIYYGEKTSFFEVNLSLSAQEKFKNIIDIREKVELGLVENNKLVGIIDTENSSVYDKFRVFSNSESESLEVIKINLSKMINEN